MNQRLKKTLILSASALMFLSVGTGLASTNNNVYAKSERQEKLANFKNKGTSFKSHKVHKHLTHKRKTNKRINKIGRKKRIIKRHKASHYVRPTYKSGYNLGHSYGKFLVNLLGSNTSHKTLFNKTKNVYLSNGLSNRNYDKGFIKGYTLSSHAAIENGGETKESLTSEAKTMIKNHNKLMHHNYAYKLGFIKVMSYNDPNKVPSKIKNNKQYKLGVKLGQQEI